MRINISFDTECPCYENLSLDFEYLTRLLKAEVASKKTLLNIAEDELMEAFKEVEKAEDENEPEILAAVYSKYDKVANNRNNLDVQIYYLDNTIEALLKASEQLHYYAVEVE